MDRCTSAKLTLRPVVEMSASTLYVLRRILIPVYAFIMAAVNLILIVQAIQEFVTHDGKEVKRFHLPSIIAVCIAFGPYPLGKSIESS